MKAILNLSIDTEVLAIAKSKGFNMSALVEGILRNEFLEDGKNEVDNLKLTNAKLTTEITNLTAELEKIKKLLREEKDEKQYTKTIHIGR